MAHEDKQDDRAKLYKMIEKVKIAMLTTIEPDGSLHTRPMGNQEADENGDFWFFMLNYSANANEPYVGAAVRCLSRDQRSVG